MPDAALSSLSEDELEVGLVLDAVVGIKDPLRDDVCDAVAMCQQAGVFVRMVCDVIACFQCHLSESILDHFYDFYAFSRYAR